MTVAVSTRRYGNNIQGYNLFVFFPMLSLVVHITIACASAANNAQQTHRLFAPLRISRFSSFCQESCISLTFCRLIMGLLLLIPNVTFGKIKPTLSGIVLPDHQPLPAFTSCVLELDFYGVSLNSETVFLR